MYWVFQKKMIFYNLMIWPILIQMVSNFNIMSKRNNSKFLADYLMSFFCFLPGIEMPFINKEKR